MKCNTTQHETAAALSIPYVAPISELSPRSTLFLLSRSKWFESLRSCTLQTHPYSLRSCTLQTHVYSADSCVVYKRCIFPAWWQPAIEHGHIRLGSTTQQQHFTEDWRQRHDHNSSGSSRLVNKEESKGVLQPLMILKASGGRFPDCLTAPCSWWCTIKLKLKVKRLALL